MRNLEVWYARLDVEAAIRERSCEDGGPKRGRSGSRKGAAKAQAKDSLRALEQAHPAGRRRAADRQPNRR